MGYPAKRSSSPPSDSSLAGSADELNDWIGGTPPTGEYFCFLQPIDGCHSRIFSLVMAEHHGPERGRSKIKVHEFPENDKTSTGPRFLSLVLPVLFLGSSCRTPVFYESETRLARASHPKTAVSAASIFIGAPQS